MVDVDHQCMRQYSCNVTGCVRQHSPAIGQLHVDMALQQHSEQIDIVVPRFAALLQRWLCSGIQVAEVHFLQVTHVLLTMVPVSLSPFHPYCHVYLQPTAGNHSTSR